MSQEQRKQELSEIAQAKANSLIPKEMPREWGLSDRGKEAVRIATAMTQTKHGLYASIPMVCKGVECPYAAVCPLVDMNMTPDAERCPLEIARILNKFDEYSREFHIDQENIVDMTLVKDLIDLDIQLFRAENKMAIDGDFIQDIVVGVSDAGEAITTPGIHKAAEYKDRIMAKRHKVLELMNSTRKDKAGSKLTVTMDPSTYASQLLSQMNGKQTTIIDVEAEEVE